MEKGVTKLFNEVDMFQAPAMLLFSMHEQEVALKAEYSKLLSSLAQTSENFLPGLRGTLGQPGLEKDIDDYHIERLSYIEERVQMMIEYLISKGT